MSQIIINTGNIANDGTGAPLRTAFTDVNNNFTQVFNAGPVGSNITIANNTIQVTNTNGNLKLATNGIGSIVPAANFVPDIPNARFIGAATNRFNTIYSQYLDVAVLSSSGNAYIAGNLFVTGNTVTNDYTNANIANLTLTLADGSSNAILANNAGIVVYGANANLLYNYSASSWVSSIAITAPTFIGDGSQLTNVNANVYATDLLGDTLRDTVVFSNLTSFGEVIGISAVGDISTTGNVYANIITGNTITGNFDGDGSNITNITANAIVGNVPFALNANSAYTANLAALATQAINADTALFAINANLAAFANVATSAQTATSAQYAVQSDNANSAVVAGMAYELSPAANLSVTGNITTSGYFIGNGSQLTGIVATSDYSNANVASYLPTYSGNLTANTISTSGNVDVGSIINLPDGQGYDYTVTLDGHGSNTAQITFQLLCDQSGTQTEWMAGIDDPGTGYAVGEEWTYDSEFLGIPGASVSISIAEVDGSGGVTNLAFTAPPLYPTSISRQDGFIALEVNDLRWTFGINGNLTLPNLTSQINYSNGVSILDSIASNYGNANVADYLPTYTGVVGASDISATGTISANSFTTLGSSGNISGAYAISAEYLYGDGSNITGLPASYSNANVADYLPIYSGNLAGDNLSITGNVYTDGKVLHLGEITGNGIVANGAGIIVGANVAEIVYDNTVFGWTVNQGWHPTANTLYNLGRSNRRWNNFYTVNVNALDVAIGNTVTANYFVGDGANITSVNASSLNGVTASTSADPDTIVLRDANANIEGNNISAGGNVTAANFTTSGSGGNITGANVISAVTITASGNIISPIFTLSDAGNLVYSTIQRNQNPPLGSEGFGIELLTTTDDPGVYSSVSAGPDYVALQSSNAGNANVTVQGGYGITLSTSNVAGGSIKEWSFVSSGDTFFPGALSTVRDISTTGNVFAQGEVSAVGNITTDAYFIGNFIGNVTGNFVVPGSNTQVLFNTNGNADATGGMTFVKGPNLFTVLGTVSAQGNVISGNVLTSNIISAGGNVYGNSFIGDGSQLTNISTNLIVNGTSNVSISVADDPIRMAVNGYDVASITEGSVSIGRGAGGIGGSQGIDSVAIGPDSGTANQGNNAIAIGSFGVGYNQGDKSIAIGFAAGYSDASPIGANVVAIGGFAGFNRAAADSIILNATGEQLNSDNSGFYVAPVRNDTSNVTNALYYNTTTNELTYGPSGSGSSSQLTNGTNTFDLGSTDEARLTLSNVSGQQALMMMDPASQTFLIDSLSGDILLSANDTIEWRFDTAGNLSVPGNIVINNTQALFAYDPNGITLTANIQQDVNGFSSQYLADTAMYASTNVQIISDAANSELTWTFDNTGNLTTPGSIIIQNGDLIGSDASPASNINGFNTINSINVVATGNVTANTFVGDQANIELIAGGNTWTFDTTGNLTTPGSGGDIVMTGGNITGAANIAVGNILTDGYYYANGTPVTFGGGSGNSISNGTSNISIPVSDGNAIVGFAGSDVFTFGTDGNLTLLHGSKIAEVTSPVPGNYALSLSGSGLSDPDQQLLVYPTFTDANHLHLTTGNLYNTELFLGNDDLYVKLANTGNVVINSNDLVGNTAQWTFETNGVLNVPGEGVIKSTDDTITLQSLNTSTGFANGVYVGTSGGLGFFDNSIPANWLEIFRNGADPQIGTPGNLLILTDSTNTAPSWNFDSTGNLTIPGTSGGLIKTVANASIGIAAMDNGSDNPAQLMSWNVNDANPNTILSAYQADARIQTDVNGNIKTWSFDNAGNLTLPGNTFAVNYANGTPVSIGGGGTANTGNIAFADTTIYVAANVAATNITIAPNGEGWSFVQIPNDDTANVANLRLHNDAGNVEIAAGDASNSGPLYNWSFDNSGNLNLPGSATIQNQGGTLRFYPERDISDYALETFISYDNDIHLQSANIDKGLALGRSYGSGAHIRLVGNVPFNAGDSAGNIVISAQDYVGGTQQEWQFGTDGNVTIPGNIQTITTGFAFTSTIIGITTGNATVIVGLTDNVFPAPVSGQVSITDVVGTTEANGTWYFEAVDSNQFQLFNDPQHSSPVDGTTWTAYVSGGLAVSAGAQDLTITAGNLTINGGSNSWAFNTVGQTIFPVLTTTRGDTTGSTLTGPTMRMGSPGYQELVITTPDGDDAVAASQRLVINPGKGADGTSGEGGDIYLWAGRGGSGVVGDVTGGSGGDIKIRGGQGMTGGDGGYIRMEGGDSNGDAGAAGFIEITAGETNGGSTGYVNITGGYNGGGYGGNININGGYGSTNGGAVVIAAGSTGDVVGNIYLNSKTFLPVTYTGEGPGESAWLKGTRTNIGGLDKVTPWAYELPGAGTPTLCYAATDTSVQSARITFAVQSNGVAANFEQFDVAVVSVSGSEALVTVSNRVRANVSIDWTEVSANVNAGVINVYLTQPTGQTVGYVNYNAVEFNIMVD